MTVTQPSLTVWDVKKIADDLGRKFEASDVTSELRHFAEVWASNYSGTFEYMLDMKFRAQAYGNFSPAQTKGVLNCFRAQAAKMKEEAKPASSVSLPACLTYTIKFEDGSHRTIKITDTESWDGFQGTGTLVAKYLSGPDNEKSYTGFAFIKANGQIITWKKFRGHEDETKICAALNILMGTEDRSEFKLAYAKESGRCCKCGRKLTVPSSIDASMGPICAQGGIDS